MILALLTDHSRTPWPQLFSAEGWAERHKGERERLVGEQFTIPEESTASLSELAMQHYPDLFPAETPPAAPDASAAQLTPCVVACLLPRTGPSLTEIYMRGE